MSYLSDFRLVGGFLLSIFQDLAILISTTILVWIFILIIFKLCVKTIKKLIG